MKICTKCKLSLPLSEFYNHKGRSKPFSYCKKCNSKRVKEYYNRNKPLVRKNANKNRKEHLLESKKLIDERRDSPCCDCKNRFPIVCMDFDHLPEYAKMFSVCEARHRYFNLEKIKTEMEKCEVVCSNCHRIRTSKRLGSRVGSGA